MDLCQVDCLKYLFSSYMVSKRETIYELIKYFKQSTWHRSMVVQPLINYGDVGSKRLVVHRFTKSCLFLQQICELSLYFCSKISFSHLLLPPEPIPTKIFGDSSLWSPFWPWCGLAEEEWVDSGDAVGSCAPFNSNNNTIIINSGNFWLTFNKRSNNHLICR